MPPFVSKMVIAWQEGKPFQSGGNQPRGVLWASWSDDGGATFSKKKLDLALGPEDQRISWPAQVQYSDLGDIITTWWSATRNWVPGSRQSA